MTSVVGICNAALTDLGGNPIVSLYPPSGEPSTTEQKLCQAHYEPSRDVVLEAGDWSFARTQRQLPASEISPPYGEGTMFLVPPDCIRVITVSQDAQDLNLLSWRIQQEGGSRYIVARTGIAYVNFVARIEDPTLFSPMFADTVSARMAYMMAIALTQSRTLRDENRKIYEAKLDDARANDGLQGRPRNIRTNRLHRAHWGRSRFAHGEY